MNRMSEKKRIIFVAGTISQPRVLKRIKSFKNAGFETIVYAFDRGVYNVNSASNDIEVNIVGKMKSGSGYLGKLKQIYALNKVLKKKYNSKEDVFYLFGFIESIFTFLFPKKYIYEISDILYGYRRFNLIAPILRAIDKKLVRRSLLTVMTSGGFKDYLFGDKPQSNIIIQPNKLNPVFAEYNRNQMEFSCTNKDKITFSFIGAFRYPNTVFRFAHVIGKHYPYHKFKFHGDSIYREEVKGIASKYKNVEYYGEYRNPDDLPNIYNDLDFVVACYDPDGLNERIAEPNKMYEAMFFKKPILVSSNTYLAKQVDKYGCGYSIDATTDESIISFINSITEQKLNDIKRSVDKIELSDMIDDDAKYIIGRLKELL